MREEVPAPRTYRPLLHSFSTALWRNRFPLWGRCRELLRTRRKPGTGPTSSSEPLVPPARRGVELSSRPPAREGGMTRRRGSTRSGAGSPGPTAPPGDGAGGDRSRGGHRPGNVTRSGHRGGSSAQCLETPQRKGPCSSYLEGPFRHLSPSRGLVTVESRIGDGRRSPTRDRTVTNPRLDLP